jgi:uncharacterized Zn-finger protein
MGKKIYDLEFFKNLAIEKNGECLSTEYVSCTKKLLFKCEFGHIWETKPYYLTNNDSWCPYCNKFHKDNLDTFKKIAIEKNGECLSNEYFNAKSKLRFKCDKGHIWESVAHDVKYSKSWCPYCSNSVKLTIEEMCEIALNRNGKCLSEEYINSHTKLLWECEKGHQWHAKPYLVKNLKNWCPYCRESLGERRINKCLQYHNINFIREYKFNDCRGISQRLPFDFYLPEINVLIEYDGRQHFKPVNFYGCSKDEALKSFLELKQNDEIKNKYCADNNIKLIRIPYNEKNIEEFLKIILFENCLV